MNDFIIGSVITTERAVAALAIGIGEFATALTHFEVMSRVESRTSASRTAALFEAETARQLQAMCFIWRTVFGPNEDTDVGTYNHTIEEARAWATEHPDLIEELTREEVGT